MRDNEQQVVKKELHRVRLELEPDHAPRLELIHPKSGCEVATVCGECGMSVGDPEHPGCDFCPTGDEGCWVTGWVDQFSAEEMLAGHLEFAVIPECDGEALTLHIAAEPDDASVPTQQKDQA